ncbi:MAG: TRAP transporter small permease [Christensenellales bacterium]
MILKKILSPVSDALDRVCSVLIVVMLGLMVVITTAQIVCRTFFTSLSWSDEVTRYLLIWSTFLGATCVYRQRQHRHHLHSGYGAQKARLRHAHRGACDLLRALRRAAVLQLQNTAASWSRRPPRCPSR